MTEEEAKRRFFTLGFLRLFGVALAALGIAVVARRFVEPAEPIGYLLIAVGIIDVVVIPPILIRAWKKADK